MATNGGSQHPQEIADAQLHDIMKHDASKGATIHSFDPDASPQQKAAAAGKKRDQLKSVTQQDRTAQGEQGPFLFLPRQSSNVIRHL
jgi:hypothetical protein